MVTRDKGGHYILIKGSREQEDITLNIYASNNIPSKQISFDIGKLINEYAT